MVLCNITQIKILEPRARTKVSTLQAEVAVGESGLKILQNQTRRFENHIA